ncbi:MAG TPA: VOC family protein [Bryobacteraceae bacterium]|nr:VOC family protein [Bryobacteraceae bacterium]
MQLNPYLIFNGQCEAAFKFYEQSLGGKITATFANEGSPMAEHVPAEWRNKILHARMTVGDQILMGSDGRPGVYQEPKGFSLSLSVNDPAEAECLFHSLADGGQVQMPMQKTFWAERFGMLTDRFGMPWMVNCEQQTA